ncbi:hypothetical protein SAMN05421823_102719 [Catalinimonas alkaloidigena]|uniref:Glycerol kinase n=1 Tax=Catalinimonas alkaloidigena TaxID=1075417 RepID=A0A1G9BUS0_9BACT|nr:hypothetical protein [Catalinimonas alkaloidigena]SDK43212.1 hypothetical protein SAMN05421823_102719 [Catalinimonas alkaloidigena]
MRKISTSALAKTLDTVSRELFNTLFDQNFISRQGDQWVLTSKGEECGGEVVISDKYGQYIVWPPDFNPLQFSNTARQDLINATSVGKEFDLSSQRMNLVFAEIGWIAKGVKGWEITDLGKKVRGVQIEHQSGGTFVMWPTDILSHKVLLRSVGNAEQLPTEQGTELNDFRQKFPANLRAKDGHLVRSRAEVIIDNALYDYGIVHAYERRLPLEEDVYSDFYVPNQVNKNPFYIEYWGLENDAKYQERKKVKQAVYAANNLNLIELDDRHIENLEDHLPKMLLKFGIRVD